LSDAFCQLLRPAELLSSPRQAAATVGPNLLLVEIDVLRRASQDERRRTAMTVSTSRCQPPDVVEGVPPGRGSVEPAEVGEFGGVI